MCTQYYCASHNIASKVRTSFFTVSPSYIGMASIYIRNSRGPTTEPLLPLKDAIKTMEESCSYERHMDIL